MNSILPVLILNGRPASGKSEVINYLHGQSDAVRREKLHLGKIIELDDFPMLWAWFEEDALLRQKFGRDGLHTTPDGYFLYEDLWHLLMERLNIDYEKLRRDIADLEENYTVLVEFSRGTEHGGYVKAYDHLSDGILRRGGAMFIDVSWEESLRKNRRRFNPNKPDSILEHGLPDEKLEKLYREVDWETFSAGDSEYLNVRDIRVPYVVFDNHDDVTTTLGAPFEERLQARLATLWERWIKVHE